MLDFHSMPTDACCICSQIAGDAGNDLIAHLLPHEPYMRRVLLENEAFAVIPSLGPLTPGHSLLCPKKHIRSFAALDDALWSRLAIVRTALCDALQSLYSERVHLFEHGMAREGNRTACTVEHAHMHFVPLPEGLDFTTGVSWMELDGSLESLRAMVSDREYVLYATPDGTSRVLIADGIESQFMRRLIAERLHRTEWDWRAAPHARAADAAWRRFVER